MSVAHFLVGIEKMRARVEKIARKRFPCRIDLDRILKSAKEEAPCVVMVK